MVQRRRLEWLGHVARMPDHRIPKSMLFGWLSQPRPLGGQALKEMMGCDLERPEDEWYEEAESRPMYRLEMER